ncbi:MAG: 4-(cytidine 5'-diphospho)-2-C-methyl-D-erythritol kinase [Flavobacteriales bacterium CG_4_10_14_0_2_um_filter_32_8]|nr:MAG: 4-(cytidine 5'-diphospho)-2-C-methyl-D-erythritol kinase [Flavobacteriales bacterium CG_4_10_14_0_2_um_filter_32_8]
MIVFPNAKINIGLNIIEKRKDGFHNLESIFYPVVDLFDVLEVVKNSENQLEFSTSGIEILGDFNDNLCVKAYRLLQQDFLIPAVKIHLHKVIPIGAGLGGGSADAAFMLKILNELFNLNITTNQLINYAQKLGSDCAFFIKNKPIYAFHKGDEFEEVALDLSSYTISIEYPNIHINTAEAYREISPKKSTTNLKELIKSPIHNWKSTIKNDFEESIFPNHPEIESLKQEMYKKEALYASMTGSGSAVYGIFKKQL